MTICSPGKTAWCSRLSTPGATHWSRATRPSVFPTEGDGLRLTIDSCIQHYLENALSYAVQEHHVAARAVGIVMDVNTGGVLAMSTTPSYDPNEPRVIADTAARNTVEALTGDARKAALQLAQQTQWRNKAVSDLYEPGSVFKLITCAAALDAGAITKHSSFYCGESISVAGTRFHCANHKRHGAQSVTQALENSCNQSFIQIGGPAGQGGLLRLFCLLRPAGAHRHRPARRAEKRACTIPPTGWARWSWPPVPLGRAARSPIWKWRRQSAPWSTGES